VGEVYWVIKGLHWKIKKYFFVISRFFLIQVDKLLNTPHSSCSPTTLLLHLLTVITCHHHFLLAYYNNPHCLLHSHIILLSFSSALLLPIHPNSLISIIREWTKVNNCYNYNQILLACSVILFPRKTRFDSHDHRFSWCGSPQNTQHTNLFPKYYKNSTT